MGYSYRRDSQVHRPYTKPKQFQSIKLIGGFVIERHNGNCGESIYICLEVSIRRD